MTFEEISENLKGWATERNILQKENGFKQLLKLSEEKGELCSSYLKGDSEGTIDGIGDCLVVLTIFCHQNNLNPVDCLESAWNEIKDRKGKTENGVFIKN